ncbi:MAG: hypothetical protein RL357_1634 [Pseudomonadota bacterium]|jgi:SM-20-related protein
MLDQLADALAGPGWVVQDDAVPASVLARLRHRLHGLGDQAFHKAGVGRQADHQQVDAFRNDRIHWLEASDPEEAAWLDWADQLRAGMNGRLFMGLSRYECHFAHYAPGHYYKKHVDAFKGQANRRLSSVLYLNESWDEQDGGELVIYTPEHPEQVAQTVVPKPGRLVLFLSEGVAHEVLPARRDRYSIAGWFRVRDDFAP